MESQAPRSVLFPPLLAGILVFAAAPSALPAEEFSPPSRVTAVTVYRDGALVTREAKLALPAGDHRVLLKEIPAVADPASVRVTGTGTGGATIGGVEVAQDFRQPGLVPEYKALEKQLQDLTVRMAALDDRQKSIESLREFLGSLKATAGQESSKDLLTRGFAVESWQKAFDFLSSRLNGLAEEQRAMAPKRKELAEEIDVVRRKMAQISSQGGIQRWTATVLLAAPRGGEMTLKATYLARSASWIPLYDARLDAATGKVEIVWQSQVTQNTGEDWKNVAVTLSTTRPAAGIDLPELATLQVRPMVVARKDARTLIDGVSAGAPEAKSVEELEVVTAGASAEFNRAQGGFANIGTPQVAPAPMEMVEAATGRRDVAVTFDLPGRLDIPSDGQPHKQRIASRTMEAKLEYHAIPKVVPAVYLVARVTLPGEVPLLPGRVQHFVGPDMVGSSWMAGRAGGEEFPLSFGPDDRLKASRKLVSQKVDHKGRDDETDSRFVTTLENRLDREASIELKDQIPVSGDERVTVNLDNADTMPGFTTDPNEPGILTWKIAVPPGGKKEVVLRYRVRAPRAMPLTGLQ